MSDPNYERAAATIADVLARIVLTQPDDEEEPDVDDRLRKGLDRRPD